MRFKTLAAMAEAEQAVQEILETTHLAGTTTTLAGRAAFLPLEQTPANRALFEHYVAEPGRIPDGGGAPDADLAQRVTDWLAGMTDRYAIRAWTERFVPQGLAI